MIIRNAWICQLDEQDTVRPVFGDMEVADGQIVNIAARNENRFHPVASDLELDAQGRVLTTPLVNFHEHIYSRLAKGLPISGPMTNFTEILENLWWKLDRLLDLEMVKASAQMAALECLQAGVTYLFDHHASPFAAKGSLQTIAQVLSDFDLRSVMAFEISDRNGPLITQESLQENIDFLANHTNANVKGMIGLHALFTLDEATLQKVGQALKSFQTGVHIHLAEDQADVRINQQKFHKGLAQRLVDHQLLNERSLLIHGVHLTAQDYEIIRQTGAALVYNPDSNLNNAVGLPEYAQVPADIPTLMGTDGMHANAGRSLKQFFLLMRFQGNSFENTFARVQKVFQDQLNFVRLYFPDFPTLQEGTRADFVLWNYRPPTPLTADNFWGHYLYGLLESPPFAVFQAGRQLTSGARLLIQDLDKIYDNIRKQGHRLYQAFKEGA